METKKLYRSCKNQILGGVAGGLGEYLVIDPTVIRLIFLVLIFSGIGPLVYILAWVLIPLNPECENKTNGAEEIKKKAETIAQDIRTEVDKKDNYGLRMLFGVALLGFGFLLLFENFVGSYVWKIFWPTILVLIGLYFISKSSK